MRKDVFANGEIYHIFGHGIENRNIFNDESELERFYSGMKEFNSVDPIGSLYERYLQRKNKKEIPEPKKIVNIIAYCLNPNHYHFILEQIEDGGISKFMHRLLLGYTKYINNKLKRRGSLFEGVFMSKWVNKDDYLMHLSAYVNLNDKVHGLENFAENKKLIKSRTSWKEYLGEAVGICDRDNVMRYFTDISQYKDFAEYSLEDTIFLRESIDFEH